MHSKYVYVIGGGLAGTEAAFYLYKKGINVTLYEMRPHKMTTAHSTPYLAELVCSNSFKSEELTNAHGMLKREMNILGSFLLDIAGKTRIPGGKALVVDRNRFSSMVTNVLGKKIKIERREIVDIPKNDFIIISTGPLTSRGLSEKLKEIIGIEHLFYFDAVSPIVSFDSLDMDKAFFGSRYGYGKDYLNCPMKKEEYEKLIEAILSGEKHLPHIAEDLFFEGCLPIEEMARRGKDTLRFSLMKPVGLSIPRKFTDVYAVVQLRKENREGTMWNIVGFQTRLKYSEQKRVFRMIPCLKNAEFLRFGKIHRNTYLNSPKVLDIFGKLRQNIFIAGTLLGVEGYMESAVTGIIAGINAFRSLQGLKNLLPTRGTMIRGLYDYISTPKENFQPINANFGLIELYKKGRNVSKKEYRMQLVERSTKKLEVWRNKYEI